jgi:hypothetical protein
MDMQNEITPCGIIVPISNWSKAIVPNPTGHLSADILSLYSIRQANIVVLLAEKQL